MHAFKAIFDSLEPTLYCIFLIFNTFAVLGRLCRFISPGSLSILITMLRHNMAAISEIADFRTRSALFVICSVILGLSTHSSIGESQGRNELHVCQRWRMKANDEGANFTRKEKEHFKFCVQIRYVFPLCR